MDTVFFDCVNRRRIISLGPYYVQASLRDHGHESLVVPLHEGSEEPAIDRILALHPKVIGFSVDISNLAQSAACAAYVKSKSDALVLAGGPQVTLEKQKFLEEYSVYDLAVVGEGEDTMLELCEALRQGKPIDRLIGTVVRVGAGVRYNGERPLRNDLDMLSFPKYDLVGFSGHTHPLITSRGCPYDCVFCCTKELYSSRRWRARTPENVLAELKDIRRRGFRRIAIWDDAFNTDIRRAKRIFQLVIDADLGLQFSFPNGVRANCLDEELVALMRRAGVIRIPFGVEDLDPVVAEKIGKRLKRDVLEEACGLLHKYGYRTEAFMIVGLPDSTFESTMRSLEAVKSVGIDLARWYIAVPYTNTELYRWVQDHARMLEGEQYGTGTWSSRPPVMFETDEFRKDERLKAFYYCNAQCNNFLVLGGEVNRTKPMVAAMILGKLLEHGPEKIPEFVPWLVRAAVDPMKWIFNEPYRRRTLRDRFDGWWASKLEPTGAIGSAVESIRGAPRVGA